MCIITDQLLLAHRMANKMQPSETVVEMVESNDYSKDSELVDVTDAVKDINSDENESENLIYHNFLSNEAL